VPGNDSERLEMPYPKYRCPMCGKDLPLTETRLLVSCADHRPAEDALVFAVRDAKSADQHAIEEICDRAWGETEIDVFGSTFDVLASENLIADADGQLAGIVSLAVDAGQLAVVMFSVYPEFQGRHVGSALIEAAAARAVEKNLQYVRAAISNDDIPMLYFYQRHGFAIYELAEGLLADRLGYAAAGFSGIPIRDEVRLRRPVCG
jgi:ribosomal protein S18 acetylase RimI-like enzyme